MSVNVLVRPWSPVKISDELESFFHVLVYYSILYLRSNCECSSSFVDNYFNDYAGPGRALTCGWKSLTVEIDDWLCNQMPYRDRVEFDSPMDDLLGEIHLWLKGLYKTIRYDLSQAMLSRQPKKIPNAAAPIQPPPKYILPIQIPESVLKRFEEMKKSIKESPRIDSAPTPEDRERGQRLMDHRFIIEHIGEMLRSSQWPEDDRVPFTDERPAPPINVSMDVPITGDVHE